jgi:hypothetical protein
MNTIFLTLALSLAPQDTTGPKPVTLKFGWPETGQVHVLEKVLKKGGTARTSYDLSWVPDPEGDGILVSHSNFKFLTVNGMDATHPAIKDQLAEAAAMASAVPRIRVDAEGYLVEVEPLDEMLDRMFAPDSIMTEGLKNREAVEKMMRTPQMQQVVSAKIGGLWSNWVGLWVDEEVERGGGQVYEIDMDISGGVVPEMVMTYGEREKHRGKECVEITMTGEADPERFLAAIMGFIDVAADATGNEPLDLSDSPFTKISRTEVTRGILCVDGLRPSEILTSMKSSLTSKGESEPTVQLEEHHYIFEWPDLEPLTFEKSALKQ